MYDYPTAYDPQQSAPVNPWEDWWAWYPVTTIGGERIWLKKICRRVVMKYGDQRLQLEYEYGTVFDILRES
jgi:hypothetical protein